MKEYYEEDDWRCPECGDGDTGSYVEDAIYYLFCEGCGMTISDTWVGDDFED